MPEHVLNGADMTLWRLIGKEILHRKGNFALSVVGVTVAVGSLVATVAVLKLHDLRTGQIIARKTAETEAVVRQRKNDADRRAAELKEAYRKIMLQFGYNLAILPADEPVVPYGVQGVPTKTMDESAVKTLSGSGIMTVQHLLPILRSRQVVIHDDQRLEVFLVGTRGEIPIAHRDVKKPLLASVGTGEIILGADVAAELGVDRGETVRLIDRQFKVAKVYDRRGSGDDVTAWIDLATAQAMLGRKGRINAILALSCLCTGAQLDNITKDIVRILPGTRVHVETTNAIIRYEARVRAAEEARSQVLQAARDGREDIERAKAARAELKGQIEAVTAWLAPLVLVVAAIWTGLLALGNVRDRRVEIGVLRALGLRSGQVLVVFLARAAGVGVIGALLGYLAGSLAAGAWRGDPPAGETFSPLMLAVVVVAAPLLSVLAGWAPATLASRQDPAEVLREE